MLATSRTRRWLGGIAAGIVLLGFVAEHEVVYLGSATDWVETIATPVVNGRFGIMSLFAVTNAYVIATATGAEIPAWSHLPTLGGWLGATVLWTVALISGVWTVLGFDRSG